MAKDNKPKQAKLPNPPTQSNPADGAGRVGAPDRASVNTALAGYRSNRLTQRNKESARILAQADAIRAKKA